MEERYVANVEVMGSSPIRRFVSGCSTVVVRLASNQRTGVRFFVPAVIMDS